MKLKVNWKFIGERIEPALIAGVLIALGWYMSVIVFGELSRRAGVQTILQGGHVLALVLVYVLAYRFAYKALGEMMLSAAAVVVIPSMNMLIIGYLKLPLDYSAGLLAQWVGILLGIMAVEYVIISLLARFILYSSAKLNLAPKRSF